MYCRRERSDVEKDTESWEESLGHSRSIRLTYGGSVAQSEPRAPGCELVDRVLGAARRSHGRGHALL